MNAQVPLAPWPEYKKGRRDYSAKKFCCGPYGRLTVKQICAISGMSDGAIRHRISSGFSGDKLLARRLPLGGKRKCDLYTDKPCQSTIELAVKLARAYPTKPPTVRKLISAYGMSRATAYRWVQRLAVV
jgi:predicted DNA-binding transcriptional regulator AlpA